MLAAETAVFVEFKPVRIVLFVLHRVIVALFAFAARQSDLNSHFRHLLFYLASPAFLYLPQTAAERFSAALPGTADPLFAPRTKQRKKRTLLLR